MSTSHPCALSLYCFYLAVTAALSFAGSRQIGRSRADFFQAALLVRRRQVPGRCCRGRRVARSIRTPEVGGDVGGEALRTLTAARSNR